MRTRLLEEALVIAYAALAGLQREVLPAGEVANRLEAAMVSEILAARPELAAEHLAAPWGWKAASDG